MGDFALDERLVLDELGKDGGRQRLARCTAVSATCFSVAYGKDMVARDRMARWARSRFRWTCRNMDETDGSFDARDWHSESDDTARTRLSRTFLSRSPQVVVGLSYTALDSTRRCPELKSLVPSNSLDLMITDT